MGGPADAPDALLSDYYSGIDQCGALTEAKIDEYAAMIKFIGLLAGVGDAAEVERARNAIGEAIARALEVPDELRQAEEAARQAELDFLAVNQGLFGDTHMARDATLRPAVYMNDSEHGPALLANEEWMNAWNANNEAREASWRLAAEIEAEEWRAWIQGWVDWFNNLKTMLLEGRVLEMLCTILVEGVFVLMEEVVIWGISAAAAMVTGGAGAIAVRISATAVAAGSRVARITIAAARTTGRREAVETALGNANDVPFGNVDASDVEGLPNLRNEEELNGNLLPPEAEEIIDPNPTTPTSTLVDGSRGTNEAVWDVADNGNPVEAAATLREDFGSTPRNDPATEIGHRGGAGL